ncbi:MAG: hypothetical protein K1W19_06350 [Lachnospiraceae bacterium]|nr:hypothetical protein [Lachnospiraceae bacterium]MCI8824770.1 hypothetical protein [Lachnospiraceae bacterium]MCI9369570.1 hypothetical protein [Lachnospiraceae bacterium]
MNEILINILEDMGFFVLDQEQDFDIRDYISDSIQFMDFIVRIEDKLQIELSDDFLDYDLLLSSVALANKIEIYKDSLEQ